MDHILFCLTSALIAHMLTLVHFSPHQASCLREAHHRSKLRCRSASAGRSSRRWPTAVPAVLAICSLSVGASHTPDGGGSLLVPTTRCLLPCTVHQPANGTSQSVQAAGWCATVSVVSAHGSRSHALLVHPAQPTFMFCRRWGSTSASKYCCSFFSTCGRWFCRSCFNDTSYDIWLSQLWVSYRPDKHIHKHTPLKILSTGGLTPVRIATSLTSL